MAWCLVCPASRGVGFALTRHLLQTTKVPIVATARKDIEAVKKSILSDLDDVNPDRLTVLEVDVTDETSISTAASKCKILFPPPLSSPSSPSSSSSTKHQNQNPPQTQTQTQNSNQIQNQAQNQIQNQAQNHLRLAFCLPGILLPPERSPSQINSKSTLETFKVNTIGPMLVFKHFCGFLSPPGSSPPSTSQAPEQQQQQNLPKNTTFTILSARLGSTTDNTLGGWYSYRASKAALFSLTRSFDIWLAGRFAGGVGRGGGGAGGNYGGVMAIAMHPGTVRTGLSRGFLEGRVRGGKEQGKEQEGKERKKEKKKGDILEPEEAAERLVAVVRDMELQKGRGRCWDWRGVEILP